MDADAVHRPDNTVTVSFYRTETQIKKDKMSVTGQLGNYAGSEITGTVNDTNLEFPVGHHETGEGPKKLNPFTRNVVAARTLNLGGAHATQKHS
jgi:hypothetical protein